ncbi:polyhydroxybutyrate depolymerase [Cognatiyoonia sp. IB215446]|uniref:alpha/beta hydrolase family esterase n=1 Tax=Cognatiyoonia sp. IB215446 TaxID=3097355 RepID=UPI002A163CA6|nr:polyhydroxybutyrate depolymerase [Cognatiyoonia sp. IB215446]MDX8349588.1 polyhydroxybutyrate depolymerase [Cognatiyoonia sp. IB215446]
MIRLLVCCAAAFLALTSTAAACEGQVACPLGDRSYHLRVPDNWDGQSALPVLLHFHGWARQGDLIVRHDRIATKIVADEVLLLAPNGLNKTWSFQRAASPDTAFARAVIEDAASRYSIDRERIFVSGYSWGARMAWRFVCEDGDGIAALLAVAGTLPQDISCATQPAQVRQVFGLDDQVLPFPFGPGGDQTYPVALWREAFACGTGRDDGPWAARSFLTFQRTSWDCPGGAVVLDVHPGGHFIPHDWIPLQIAEILAAEQGD